MGGAGKIGRCLCRTVLRALPSVGAFAPATSRASARQVIRRHMNRQRAGRHGACAFIAQRRWRNRCAQPTEHGASFLPNRIVLILLGAGVAAARVAGASRRWRRDVNHRCISAGGGYRGRLTGYAVWLMNGGRTLGVAWDGQTGSRRAMATKNSISIAWATTNAQ